MKIFYLFMGMLFINIFPASTLHAQQSHMPDVGGIVCGNVREKKV